MNAGYQAYLPGLEVNHDQEGGSSRVRPVHCTSDRLTSAISSNVGNSEVKFILCGLRSRYPLLTTYQFSILYRIMKVNAVNP